MTGEDGETIKITKKLIRELVEEYVVDGDKPDSQLESRFSDCFDKKSIVDELKLSIDEIENIRRKEDLRRVIRILMKLAEEHANSYKRVKVISEDIAYAYKQLQASVQDYL